MEHVTIDLILDTLTKWVEERTPISPDLWVDSAQKLVLLSGDEADRLYELEQKVACMRVELLTGGMNATGAKMHVEASDEYKEARKLKAKIGRIEEIARISKLRARLASEEMRNQ